MTIRLRPHHLLCLLTYAGKGYSPDFVANFDALAERLVRDEIVIVEGPDDICAPLLDGTDPHCLNASVIARDERAARQVGQLLGDAICPGTTLVLTADLLSQMRGAFSSGHTRQACDGCEWSGLCSAIAANGYDVVRIGSIATDRRTGVP